MAAAGMAARGVPRRPVHSLPLLLLVALAAVVATHAFVLPGRAPGSRALQHRGSTAARRRGPVLLSSSPTASTAPAAAAASDPALPEVTRSVVQLSTGLAMEVLSCAPGKAKADAVPAAAAAAAVKQQSSSSNPFEAFITGLFGGGSSSSSSKAPPAVVPAILKRASKPPLVFVHGSFHSAWCWAEHFLPFFAAQGYPCCAISCRGTSKSPSPDPQEKAIRIATHAADLRAFLDAQYGGGRPGPAPIVIGHSFGGAILMKVLEQDPSGVGGAAFVCSVPPSGNGPMTARFLKRDFLLALKIVVGFVAKKGAEWSWLARELFFDASLDDAALSRYKARLKADSVVGIDVKDFLKELPSLRADPATGQGAWVGRVPHRLVVGAEFDKLVDREGVEEMAAFADVPGGQPVFLPLPHDVMLGAGWPKAAQAILDWLDRIK